MALQLLNLNLSHLVFGVIEYFLAEHFQNIEVVFADVHVFQRCGTDIIDECPPSGVPLVFDNLNEGAIRLGENIVPRFGNVVQCS